MVKVNDFHSKKNPRIFAKGVAGVCNLNLSLVHHSVVV